MTHRHRPRFTYTFGWSACVNPDVCNRRGYGDLFHGNIVDRERCNCGAYRYIERSSAGYVAGPWQFPTAYEAKYNLGVEKDCVMIRDADNRTAIVFPDNSAVDFDGRPFEHYFDMLSQWRGAPAGEIRIDGTNDRSCRTRGITYELRKLSNLKLAAAD